VGVSYRNLLGALGADLSYDYCLNPFKRICRIVTIATLITDSDYNVLKDHKPCFMLKGFTLYTFFSNRSLTVLALISKLTLHISGSVTS